MPGIQTFLIALAVLSMTAVHASAAIVLDKVADKDNIIASTEPDLVQSYYVRGDYTLIAQLDTTMSYLVFDMSAYKDDYTITDVTFDYYVNRQNGTSRSLCVLNVAADWDENTMTWNNSTAYGHTAGDYGFSVAARTLTGHGVIAMPGNGAQTMDEAGIAAAVTSYGSDTYAQLLAALNNDADGVLVLGFYSTVSGSYWSHIVSRDDDEASKRPTLHLTLQEIPEPASLVLLSAGTVLVLRRKY